VERKNFRGEGGKEEKIESQNGKGIKEKERGWPSLVLLGKEALPSCRHRKPTGLRKIKKMCNRGRAHV